MYAKDNSHELKLTRIYDAPVKLVWDAWTDPKKAAKWWGPRGFTITTHSKDLRVGGHWKYTMHGPDGTDYPNKTTYFEVEKYSRLVYDHAASETTPPLFRVTVDFKEENNKTKMTMVMALATPEAAKEIAKFIKMAGGNSTWDRLAEYLGDEHGKETFVINRVFKTDIKTMFDMWTNPEHLAKWLPPSGFVMKYIKADVKVGGTSLYSMTDGQTTMFNRAHYLEISPNTRFAFTQTFVDETGNVTRHPMLPVFPEVLLNTIELSQEGDETRVTLTTAPYGKAPAEEIAMFKEIRGGMTMGWTGSFDKLEEIL